MGITPPNPASNSSGLNTSRLNTSTSDSTPPAKANSNNTIGEEISRQEFLIEPKIINKSNLNPNDKTFNLAFGLICELYKIDQKKQEEVKQALIYLMTKRDVNLLTLNNDDKVVAAVLLKPMLASPTKPYIFCNAGCNATNKKVAENIKAIQDEMFAGIENFAKQQGATFTGFDIHRDNKKEIKIAEKAGYTKALLTSKWIEPANGIFPKSDTYPIRCAILNEANEKNTNKLYDFYSKQNSNPKDKDNDNNLKEKINKSLGNPNCFLLGLESLSGELLAVVPVTKGVEMFSPDCYVIGEMIFDQEVCKKNNLTIPKIIEAAITNIAREAVADKEEFQPTVHEHLPDKPKDKLIGYVHFSHNTEISPLEEEIKDTFEKLNFSDHGKTIEIAKYIPFQRRCEINC